VLHEKDEEDHREEIAFMQTKCQKFLRNQRKSQNNEGLGEGTKWRHGLGRMPFRQAPP
jgi:hypothetical protein